MAELHDGQDAAEPLRQVPVAFSQQRHGGRYEEHAHDRGVEQDCNRKGEAELVGTFTLAGIVGLLTLSLTNAKPIEDPMPMMAMFILFVLPYCARRELT